MDFNFVMHGLMSVLFSADFSGFRKIWVLCSELSGDDLDLPGE